MPDFPRHPLPSSTPPAGPRIEADLSRQRAVEVGPVPVGRTRALRRGRDEAGPGRGEAAGGGAGARPKLWDRTSGPAIEDEPIQRVVRKRRIRPELVVIVFGLVFAAGAVAKPWGTPKPAVNPTANPEIGLVATPPPTASPARTPLISREVDPVAAALGPRGMGGRDWVEVSWQALSIDDPHAALGVAAIGAAVVPYNGPYLPAPPLPVVAWQARTDPGTALKFTPPANGRIFALGATWPATVEVSAISISSASRTGTSKAGVKIKALPAQNVDITAMSSAGSRTATRSGEFWVPPSGHAPPLKGMDLAIAWQFGPWSWPAGSYVITLTTKTGPIALPFVVE
jgi:hypothetical protein